MKYKIAFSFQEVEEEQNENFKSVKTHLDYNISISLNSINNIIQVPPSPQQSPNLPVKLELGDIVENESLVSLHEFKVANSVCSRPRSGSEISWNYKKQFGPNMEKIPYIDELSQSLVASSGSKGRLRTSVCTNKSKRFSKLSTDIRSVSGILVVNSVEMLLLCEIWNPENTKNF